MRFSSIIAAAVSTVAWYVPVFCTPATALRAQDAAALLDSVKNNRDVFSGIRMLDSLRVSGCVSEAFLEKYAQYVFDVFLPAKNDSFPALLKNAEQVPSTDTAFPCAFRWRIVTVPKAVYPFFEYWAGFTFRKRFRLVFPGIKEHFSGRAWLGFHDREVRTSIADELIAQLDDRIDSAWCTIHIDINDTRTSPYEYILKRIDGVYDSIEVKTDLSKYHAISLRCLKKRLFHKPEGISTAYIVFDRSVRQLLKDDPAARKTEAWKTDKLVRFTLTMRCGCDVQSQAEQKLLSILRSF